MAQQEFDPVVNVSTHTNAEDIYNANALDAESRLTDNTADIATNTSGVATNVSNLSAHEADTTNPHSVTKAQVGLTDADDTSDVAKPVSTATQTALDLKQDVLAEGAFPDGSKTKLDGIEALADVTDTTNVTSSGALMDSELASIADVKALNQSLISGATPTLTNTNFTEATDKNYVTDAEQVVIGLTSGTNTGDQDLSLYQLISEASELHIDAKVNEAAGVAIGDVVYITGATGGAPQVSLADNTDFSKADTIAVASEAGADNATITCIIIGLLEGINTSSFTEGDILYLGVTGALTATHPTGVDAVQRIGRAIKINASTGSILVDIDQLTVINDHDGIMRHQIVNQNAGTSASAAYTIVNDAGHRSSISHVGSNYTVVAGIADAMVIYNEGYGKTVSAVDGNFGFEWWTDVADSHNLSSTAKMSLLANGNLGLGTTAPAQTFHVVGEACVEHTATEADEHGLEIVLDAAGFGDVKAMDIVYTTGAIGAGEDEGVILINIDESLSTGGEVFALEVLTTTLGSDSVIALKTGVGIDPISQDSGIFGDIDSILNNAADVTTDLSTGGAGNVTIFVADNDTITVGDAGKFAELEVIIDTAASQNVQPTWEYSTGVGTWAAFTPTDGTNGFQNTGAMLWNSDDLAGWIVGTGSEYLIRVTRTRNGLTTSPIVDLIQFANPDIFSWDKDGNVAIDTLKVVTMPAYDDDTAAGVGGLTVGQSYQTTGSGSAPLNAAGIVMLKQ